MTYLGQLWSVLQELLWSWREWKVFVERSVSFSSDSVHVIAGVLIQIAAAVLLRKPLSSCLPWLAVLPFIAFNEFVDLWVERWPHLEMQYGEGFKDFLLTLLLPSVLLLASRIFPMLHEPNRKTSRADHTST